MPIYINKDNQQSGPYEDHVVIDQLENGLLSPNDLGIRQGETSWQRLGEIFPGVVSKASATPSIPIPPPVAVGNAVVTSVPAPKKGGCLKGGLIGTGLLFLFLGIAVAAGSRFIPSVSCDLAEEDAHTISKLRSDLEKAKGDGKFERINAIQFELKQALSGAEASQKHCDDDKFRNNLIAGAGGFLGFVGLLMAVIGLFVGRRK